MASSRGRALSPLARTLSSFAPPRLSLLCPPARQAGAPQPMAPQPGCYAPSRASPSLLVVSLLLLPHLPPTHPQPGQQQQRETAALRFTTRARAAYDAAGQHALGSSQPEFGVYHLAFILFDARATRSVVDPAGGPQPLAPDGSIGVQVGNAAGADVLEISHRLERAAARAVEAAEPPPPTTTPTDELRETLAAADRIRAEEGVDTHVALHHLLLACAQHDGVSAILKASGLEAKLLRKTVAELRGAPIDSAEAEKGGYEALLRYGIDIVELCAASPLPTVALCRYHLLPSPTTPTL